MSKERTLDAESRIEYGSERARREPAVGRIVSILHTRLERPIPVEPELAHEPSALAEAHTHLEELSERLAAGSPPDHRN